MFSPEQVRQDQMREGQRRTLSATGNRDVRKLAPPKKPFVAKGHDAILKNLQDTGDRASVTMIGDGTEHAGKIVARDKFTITLLLDEDGTRRTFYKHAIESFGPIGQVQ